MAETHLYKLRRSYWDGKELHKARDLVWIEEGKAPSTAVRVAEEEVAEKPAAKPVKK